jgi:SAM-dependent methyltransferase
VLAYYSVAAKQEFWSEHWGGHTVDELVAIARRSPLTSLVTRALPADGLVVEAGCGLGQYVVLLREQGWRAVGVDWSVEALSAARARAAAPLTAAELTTLPLRDGAAAAYVSLGVVEHDPSGPDAILAEARRVLAPGGALVVSAPYVNGVRRLAAPYLRLRGRAAARRGAAFYQFAFTRAELLAVLGRHGFTPRAVHPYDPARVVTKALPAAWRRRLRGGVVSTVTPAAAPSGRRPRAGRLATWGRTLLYTEPALRLFGHMLLVVAQRG